MLQSLFLFTPPGFRDDLRIEGDRITLRPRVAGDEAAMFAYASDPEVVRYLPWEPVTSIGWARAFLGEQTQRRRRGDSLDLAIVLRETGQMIGQTDLMDLRAIRGQAELGYIVSRPHWGQGLMTEAARLTLAHGFDVLRLSKIIAFADRDNVASQRVMQKAGMRFVSGETRLVKGEERPYVRYEITRLEWDQRPHRMQNDPSENSDTDLPSPS